MSARTGTPVFVYGTLREGEALAGLLPKAHRYDATVDGTLHYSPHTMGYPVMVPDVTNGAQTTGELLWLNLDDPDVAYVVIMEIQAGYCAEWRTVYFDGNPDAGVDALVFTWTSKPGTRIEGDDWRKRGEGAVTFFCRECGEEFDKSDRALECEWLHDEDDYITAIEAKENA